MAEPGDAGVARGRATTHATEYEETTSRLLDAAVAELVEHGYDKALVSNIARRAGVSTGAVYGRWPRKTDLMVATLDSLFEQLLPTERVKQLVRGEVSMFEMWSASLLEGDPARVALILAFGARGNDKVQARLREFLNEQAREVSGLIERGKQEGLLHPETDTTAATLLVQAIGIGTHLVLSAGLDDRHIPSVQQWAALLANGFAVVAHRQ